MCAHLREDGVQKLFLTALRSCGKDLSQVKRVHGRILDKQLEQNKYLANQLILTYGKCSSLKDAHRVFDGVKQPDVFTWNVMISAYTQNGYLEEAKRMFDRMPQWDVVSWTSMIRALGQKGHLQEARSMFERMPQRDSVSWNIILAAYAQEDHVEETKLLFDRMSERDVVSWTTVIRAYAQSGHLQQEEARSMFEKMPERNAISWNTMIVMYSEKGDLHQCKSLFDEMPEPTVVSCTAMLAAYGQNGYVDEAKNLFETMPHCDIVSWTTMLQAYALHGNLEEAKSTFDRTPKRDAVSWTTMLATFAQKGHLDEAKSMLEKMPKWDMVSANAIIAAYAQNGQFDDAKRVFHIMPEQDLLSWTSLIAGYAHNGHSEHAIDLFQTMVLEGVQPDEIVCLSILTACSHVGLVDEGWRCFVSMAADHGVNPIAEHFCCMVDILGRTGKLKDAEELIGTMPFLPNERAWGSLLAACRIHQDVDRAARIASHAIELSPQNFTPYVLLANIHSTAGRQEEMVEVRKLMNHNVVQKQPGISSIEIQGRVHRFVAGDASYSNNEEIFMMLRSLNSLLKKEGYVPRTKEELLHDVTEEVKENLLAHHSEKLALAFGITMTSPGTPLTIVKNLQVCSDCHKAIKLISKILGRHISIRDASRFHHFRNGRCSCQDNW